MAKEAKETARTEVLITGNDGRVHALRYSINAFVKIEEATSKTFTQIIAVLAEPEKANMSLHDLRAFVWGGLLHQKPNLSVEEAGNIMDQVGLASIAAAMNEAMSAAYPTAGNA